MISSVMPSLKYSFSGSALMFASGSTAIALGAARCASPVARCAPVPLSRLIVRTMSVSASTRS